MVDFAECAGRVGVRGLHPRVGGCLREVSARILQWRFPIGKRFAMEIFNWKEICSGDFQWRFAMETCNGDLQWRFAMEIFNGDFQWRFAMETLD